MNSKGQDFISELKLTFEKRCRKNPRYSLRSYAHSLGVSPGSLSRVMTGKRKLSLKMIEKIGPSLGLKSNEILNHQKDLLGFELAATHRKFNSITQDMFAIIADWYHLTILELMKLDDFEPDTRWIANRLNININQVKLAIERLQRVGILEIKKDGKWVDNTDGFTTHYQKDKTTEARKMYQLQLLEKSRDSLLKDDYSIRDHSGMTMAIDPADMMKAKDLIINFRKSLSALLENTKGLKKEVYQLQISLFPLTYKKQEGDR